MEKESEKEVRVFAPATVANVACGYDVLGFAIDAPGDEVVASDGSSSSRSDLSRYLQVLEQYPTGIMNDRQFEYVYTTMFRDDASLRSREEVEVLNSIFGDVDQHLNMHLMMAGRSQDDQVRTRAEVAYNQLKELVQATA